MITFLLLLLFSTKNRWNGSCNLIIIIRRDKSLAIYNSYIYIYNRMSYQWKKKEYIINIFHSFLHELSLYCYYCGYSSYYFYSFFLSYLQLLQHNCFPFSPETPVILAPSFPSSHNWLHSFLRYILRCSYNGKWSPFSSFPLN